MEDKPKDKVLMMDTGMKLAALMAAIGGVPLSILGAVKEAVAPRGQRIGPPVLKGKRLERLKKQK